MFALLNRAHSLVQNAQDNVHDLTMQTAKTITYTNHHKKTNKRSMAGTITGETKREGQRKAKRRTAHRNQK